MNIYVGNMSYSTTDDDLRGLFEQYGTVNSARVIADRYTNQSRGFGFVEMADDQEAENAINNLNGKDFMGRNLNINQAREKRQ